MESHTNYLTILYNLALVYKQRLKKIYLVKVKGIPSKSIIISLFFAIVVI
jgi:hypothetical protein